MTAPTRTEADFTIEGRAALGHEVLDEACYAGEPFGIDGFVSTSWFAWKLGIDQFRQSCTLLPLLRAMARHGVLEKSGGARTCRADCYGWYAAAGIDPTHTHMEPCTWRLAIDRHEAHERWDDITRQRGWWSGRRSR